jgi:hypothetical protein
MDSSMAATLHHGVGAMQAEMHGLHFVASLPQELKSLAVIHAIFELVYGFPTGQNAIKRAHRL